MLLRGQSTTHRVWFPLRAGSFGTLGDEHITDYWVSTLQARGEEKGQVQGVLRQEVDVREEAGRGAQEHQHQQGGIGETRVLDVSHMCTP